MRALVLLLLCAPASAEIGWSMQLPETATPCREWLKRKGWEEPFGAGRVPAIKAVGIKSDANNTGTRASAALSVLSFESR